MKGELRQRVACRPAVRRGLVELRVAEQRGRARVREHLNDTCVRVVCVVLPPDQLLVVPLVVGLDEPDAVVLDRPRTAVARVAPVVVLHVGRRVHVDVPHVDAGGQEAVVERERGVVGARLDEEVLVAREAVRDLEQLPAGCVG